MEPRYRDAINDASAKLSQALLEALPTLLEQGLRLDALVRDVLRTVAVALLSALYQGLCTSLVQQATDRGLTVQSRSRVRFKTLFGEVEIESPYLRHPRSGESARPMKDVLGVEGEQYQTCSNDSLRQWCAKPIGFSPLKSPLGSPHFYTSGFSELQFEREWARISA